MPALRSPALRALALCFTAALALAAAGCSSGSSSPEDIDPDLGSNDPSIVVAIGNSITFGLGDTGVGSCDESLRGAGGYAARLQRLTGKVVINDGVCGEFSEETAYRANRALSRWRPGVLLIETGVNDLTRGTNEVMRNLRTIVAAARRNKTIPIVGTLPPTTGNHRGWVPFIENVNAHIRAMCAEENLECADLHQAFVNDPDFQISPYALLTGDGLHPNPAGYALMAKTWRWPLVRVY